MPEQLAGSAPGATFLPDWLTWRGGGTSTLEGIVAAAVLGALVIPRLLRWWRAARAARRESQE